MLLNSYWQVSGTPLSRALPRDTDAVQDDDDSHDSYDPKHTQYTLSVRRR